MVVSESMGAADVINKNKLCIVTNNFSDAIRMIYRNQEYWSKNAINSKEWVERNLSWENFTKKMERLFGIIIK